MFDYIPSPSFTHTHNGDDTLPKHDLPRTPFYSPPPSDSVSGILSFFVVRFEEQKTVSLLVLSVRQTDSRSLGTTFYRFRQQRNQFPSNVFAADGQCLQRRLRLSYFSFSFRPTARCSYLPPFLSVWRAVAEFEVRRKGHSLLDSEGRPQGVVLHDVARKFG